MKLKNEAETNEWLKQFHIRALYGKQTEDDIELAVNLLNHKNEKIRVSAQSKLSYVKDNNIVKIFLRKSKKNAHIKEGLLDWAVYQLNYGKYNEIKFFDLIIIKAFSFLLDREKYYYSLNLDKKMKEFAITLLRKRDIKLSDEFSKKFKRYSESRMKKLFSQDDELFLFYEEVFVFIAGKRKDIREEYRNLLVSQLLTEKNRAKRKQIKDFIDSTLIN